MAYPLGDCGRCRAMIAGTSAILRDRPLESRSRIEPRALKLLISNYRNRYRYLGLHYCGEPCWDLLLELLLAHVEERLMPSSSVGLSPGIALSTAHRWIDRLVDAGLVERQADDRDARRVLLRLKEDAALKLEQLVVEILQYPHCQHAFPIRIPGAHS